MAEIQNTTAPTEDIILALATEPGKNRKDTGTFFAAKSSGMVRSVDAGKTWESAFKVEEMAEPLPAMCICVSPDFAEDHSVFAGVPGGVLRTFDSGKTWQVVQFSSPPPVVSAVVISPNFMEDGIILAGTNEDGVFRSLDRGVHWASSNFNLLDLNLLSLAISPDFSKDELLFAGTVSGLFRSKNGGRAWREIDFPFGYDPVLSIAFAPDFAKSRTVYAGTETQGLVVSHDAGSSWERVAPEVLVQPVNAILISQDAAEKEIVFLLHGDQVFISNDGVNGWYEWQPAAALKEGISAIAIPGWKPEGKPQILAGLVDGRILVLE